MIQHPITSIITSLCHTGEGINTRRSPSDHYSDQQPDRAKQSPGWRINTPAADPLQILTFQSGLSAALSARLQTRHQMKTTAQTRSPSSNEHVLCVRFRTSSSEQQPGNSCVSGLSIQGCQNAYPTTTALFYWPNVHNVTPFQYLVVTQWGSKYVDLVRKHCGHC